MLQQAALSDMKVAARYVAATPSFTCYWAHGGAGFAWVRMTGDLDREGAPELERTIRQAQLASRRVVLDLRELVFVDYAGMNSILAAHERAQRSGGQPALVRGSRRVNRVFALTGLCDVLEIVDLDPAEPPLQALLKLCGTWGTA